MTHFGYIKRLSPDTYRAQRRGGRGVKGQATREEDFVESLFVTSSHAPILFFTNMGRVFRIKCYAIPEAGRAAKGIPIVNLLQLQGGEKVTATIPLPRYPDPNSFLVMATRQGVIKKTPLSEFENIRKGGLIAQNLREGDELIAVEFSDGNDEFLIASKKGKAVRFAEDDVRAMGRTATGVRSITLEGDDAVVDMVKVRPDATVLTVTEKGMGKRTELDQYPLHRRGGKGVFAMMLFHVVENIGMVIGLLPVTGIPLPFMSYGGSNMLTNMMAIGLAENVIMRSRKKESHRRVRNVRMRKL